MITRVYGKLGTMRKVVDWVVYPDSRDNKLFVQSDKRAVLIDPSTRKGMLSNGKGHPGFHSTSKFCGATEIDVPQEFIDECLEAQPKKGDAIDKNGTVTIG